MPLVTVSLRWIGVFATLTGVERVQHIRVKSAFDFSSFLALQPETPIVKSGLDPSLPPRTPRLRFLVAVVNEPVDLLGFRNLRYLVRDQVSEDSEICEKSNHNLLFLASLTYPDSPQFWACIWQAFPFGL